MNYQSKSLQQLKFGGAALLFAAGGVLALTTIRLPQIFLPIFGILIPSALLIAVICSVRSWYFFYKSGQQRETLHPQRTLILVENIILAVIAISLVGVLMVNQGYE